MLLPTTSHLPPATAHLVAPQACVPQQVLQLHKHNLPLRLGG